MSLGTCSYAQIIQRWKARINFRREYLRMYAEYIHVPMSFFFFHFSSSLGNPGIVELYWTCVAQNVTVVQIKTEYVQVKNDSLALHGGFLEQQLVRL